MTLNQLKIFVATILISSCNSQKDSGKITISGKLLSPKSKTIYLNKIDHFDYFNDNYTIDSTSVSENGEFKFNSQNLSSQLVSLTTEKFKPYTYQIYRAAPETYYFGNCEKFFTAIPTFYITDEKAIDINWYQTSGIDSISSPDNTGILQVKLREFYLNSKNTDISKLDYDGKMDYKTNWEQMLVEREFDLKAANLNNIQIENSFDNYIYSEIYLGHLNNFLKWFEQNFPKIVEISLREPELDDFYSNIFSEYNKHKWNSKSLEYYKFTERYVNHYMNIESESFEHYYEPSEKKRKVADKVLDGKNKEIYLTLIDKQIKNVL